MLEAIKEKRDYDLNDPHATMQHRKIILSKPFLKKLYLEWYNDFKSSSEGLPNGRIIEIGSGGGFLKNISPDVITSDIMPLPCCDMAFPAESIPFSDQSISGIFMLNVLHHIPEVDLFFKEAERVLQFGGIIHMVEPANTWFSRFIYKNLHHESFDPRTKDWSFCTSGPLSGANIALAWIVFKRDIDTFREKYPSLQVLAFQHHTPFRYLISGGLSFRSLVPGWGFGAVTLFEKLWRPLYQLVAMFCTIKVKKEMIME